MPPPICTLRNEESDNVRGTIQVCVDGFYYYVELFKSMTADGKKGRGRPRKPEATTNLNFRIEDDILEWVDTNKGDKSRNQFINDTLRNIIGIWKQNQSNEADPNGCNRLSVLISIWMLICTL